jgi:hypothetical protein
MSEENAEALNWFQQIIVLHDTVAAAIEASRNGGTVVITGCHRVPNTAPLQRLGGWRHER